MYDCYEREKKAADRPASAAAEPASSAMPPSSPPGVPGNRAISSLLERPEWVPASPGDAIWQAIRAEAGPLGDRWPDKLPPEMRQRLKDPELVDKLSLPLDPLQPVDEFLDQVTREALQMDPSKDEPRSAPRNPTAEQVRGAGYQLITTARGMWLSQHRPPPVVKEYINSAARVLASSSWEEAAEESMGAAKRIGLQAASMVPLVGPGIGLNQAVEEWQKAYFRRQTAMKSVVVDENELAALAQMAATPNAPAGERDLALQRKTAELNRDRDLVAAESQQMGQQEFNATLNFVFLILPLVVKGVVKGGLKGGAKASSAEVPSPSPTAPRATTVYRPGPLVQDPLRKPPQRFIPVVESEPLPRPSTQPGLPRPGAKPTPAPGPSPLQPKTTTGYRKAPLAEPESLAPPAELKSTVPSPGSAVGSVRPPSSPLPTPAHGESAPPTPRRSAEPPTPAPKPKAPTMAKAPARKPPPGKEQPQHPGEYPAERPPASQPPSGERGASGEGGGTSGPPPKPPTATPKPFEDRVNFGALDEHGLATYVDGELLPSDLHTGTPTGDVYPPGLGPGQISTPQWRAGLHPGEPVDPRFRAQRGHLLGGLFGGRGTDPRNLAWMHDVINLSRFKVEFENPVRRALEAGRPVSFGIEPLYRGHEAAPYAVRMWARAGGNEMIVQPHVMPTPGLRDVGVEATPSWARRRE